MQQPWQLLVYRGEWSSREVVHLILLLRTPSRRLVWQGLGGGIYFALSVPPVLVMWDVFSVATPIMPALFKRQDEWWEEVEAGSTAAVRTLTCGGTTRANYVYYSSGNVIYSYAASNHMAFYHYFECVILNMFVYVLFTCIWYDVSFYSICLSLDISHCQAFNRSSCIIILLYITPL